jgi:hypothetical protein
MRRHSRSEESAALARAEESELADRAKDQSA